MFLTCDPLDITDFIYYGHNRTKYTISVDKRQIL
jgi:hypothetical protein